MFHKIDGVEIGKHPEICRHLRGISVARPNKGKHTYTWDADIGLSFLKTWHPLENLSYKQLAYKTLMLMALATAQRMQTLLAFNVDRIHLTGDDAILFVDKPSSILGRVHLWMYFRYLNTLIKNYARSGH